VGEPREPTPVKRIVGVLAASRDLLGEARTALENCWARVDMANEPVRWTVSSYYDREMGGEIWRQYLALAGLVRPENLVDWKLKTNELEKAWLTERGRSLNLDPGYVALDKLVLASTKDRAHRVYLAKGIYAEAILCFTKGSFSPWPYSYPDYACAATVDFFNRVRRRYRAELATRADPSG